MDFYECLVILREVYKNDWLCAKGYLYLGEACILWAVYLPILYFVCRMNQVSLSLRPFLVCLISRNAFYAVATVYLGLYTYSLFICMMIIMIVWSDWDCVIRVSIRSTQ